MREKERAKESASEYGETGWKYESDQIKFHIYLRDSDIVIK